MQSINGDFEGERDVFLGGREERGEKWGWKWQFRWWSIDNGNKDYDNRQLEV